MSWPIDRLERSIARVLLPSGMCTAFSIHTKAARFVTASHCGTLEGASINGQSVVQVLEATSGEAGLTVFQLAQGSPALRLGAKPKRGDEVLVAGYSAAPVLLFFEGLHVADSVPVDGVPVQLMSAPGFQGMSGAPVINRRRQVVGVMMGGAQITPPVPTTVSFNAIYQELARVLAKYGE